MRFRETVCMPGSLEFEEGAIKKVGKRPVTKEEAVLKLIEKVKGLLSGSVMELKERGSC